MVCPVRSDLICYTFIRSLDSSFDCRPVQPWPYLQFGMMWTSVGEVSEREVSRNIDFVPLMFVVKFFKMHRGVYG